MLCKINDYVLTYKWLNKKHVFLTRRFYRPRPVKYSGPEQLYFGSFIFIILKANKSTYTDNFSALFTLYVELMKSADIVRSKLPLKMTNILSLSTYFSGGSAHIIT